MRSIIWVQPSSARTLVFADPADGAVHEAHAGDAVVFGEAVLEVGDGGHGHEERAGDFEQRGRLDGLDVAPEVAGVVAEVAIPAATGPGFEDHGHGLFGGGVEWTHLFEDGLEDDVDGCGDLFFLDDLEGLHYAFLDEWLAYFLLFGWGVVVDADEAFEGFAFGALLDLVDLVGPVAFEDFDPFVDGLEGFGLEAVHAVLPAFDNGDDAGLVQGAEVLGDGRLGHLHADDDVVDGVLLAIGEDGDHLAAARLGDSGEDVGGGRAGGP